MIVIFEGTHSKRGGGRNTSYREPLGTVDLPANQSMKKVVGRTDHIFQ